MAGTPLLLTNMNPASGGDSTVPGNTGGKTTVVSSGSNNKAGDMYFSLAHGDDYFFNRWSG